MLGIEGLGLAIFLCIVTAMGRGSEANSQELAGRDDWPSGPY